MRAASAIFSSRHGFVEVGPQPNDHLRHSVVLAPDVAEAALDSNRLRRCRTALYVRANDWRTGYRNSLGINLRNTVMQKVIAAPAPALSDRVRHS